MASFAKLDENNVVISVHVIHNNELLDENGNESEQKGIDFLTALYGHTNWKQCSYNTYSGVHNLNGTPFRKNYPSELYTYDTLKDAFIPPKPFPSWILNEEKCIWESPIPRPDHQNGMYQHIWNEDKWNTENDGWVQYLWNEIPQV